MALTVDDFAALSRLLDEALALSPDSRERWLQALPESDRQHAAMLRTLLREAHPTDFLASLPVVSTTHEEFASAGDLLGPYRLLREIGHGGMGSVWLAERVDGTFERRVALKLPRLAWGAGLAERMTRERQIGALLEHPNIARLYDAGVDDRGRPFLAHEYIAGQPIDGWCDERKLSVTARLRLFLQVVRAVAYAHGRLVVHRDLKPSNVLVSDDGQTHLLDFGIAKRLREDAGDQTQLTLEHGRALTLHYASPEQMRGDSVTVQSDVYSLGVLLYRLLTGELPYRPRRATLAALEEAMLEAEPEVASRRSADRVVARALRGELDTILAKALRRDLTQRYATADALADDIERYLSGERVLAQRDSAWYRVRKAALRHRVGFATGAAILAAVLLGAGAAIVQARKASDAAEQARVVKDFVVDVFKVNVRDDSAKSELRRLPAELLLERGARLIDAKFAGQPRLQAELYGVVGGIFVDMGSPKLAEQYATKQLAALAVTDSAAADQARALILLARALRLQEKLADAELRAHRAIEIAHASPRLEIEARFELISVLFRRGRGQLDAVKQELAAIDAALKGGTVPPGAELAMADWVRARILARENKIDMALPVYERAIETAVQAEGPQSRLAIKIRLTLAPGLIGLGRVDAGKQQFAAALTAMRSLGGAGDIDAALTEMNFAQNLFDRHVLSKRLLPFEELLATYERVKKNLDESQSRVPDAVRADLDCTLGWAYLGWGDIARAHALCAPHALARRSQSEAPATVMSATVFLAVSANMRGELAEAERYHREALEFAKQVYGNNPGIEFFYFGLSRNLSTQGRFDEADALLASASVEPQRGALVPMAAPDVVSLERALVQLDRGEPGAALALLPPEREPFDDNPLEDRRLLRGAALCALGRSGEGLPLLDTYTQLVAEQTYAYHPVVAFYRAKAGLCALDNGNRVRAMELAALAREAFTQQPGVSSYFKAPLGKLEARLAR